MTSGLVFPFKKTFFLEQTYVGIPWFVCIGGIITFEKVPVGEAEGVFGSITPSGTCRGGRTGVANGIALTSAIP